MANGQDMIAYIYKQRGQKQVDKIDRCIGQDRVGQDRIGQIRIDKEIDKEIDKDIDKDIDKEIDKEIDKDIDKEIDGEMPRLDRTCLILAD